MAYRKENNPQLKNTNLSLKLLKGSASPYSPYFQKSITSLQDLGNRLKIANQGYSYGRSEHDAAKEWNTKRGVNISNVLQIAREVKKKQRVKQDGKDKITEWEKLEYSGFDSLTIDDFLHQSEQRIAISAVMSSFTASRPNNHMKRLQQQYLNTLRGAKSETMTTPGQPYEEITRQLIGQFIGTYRQLLNQNGPFDTKLHHIAADSTSIGKCLWVSVLQNQIQMIDQLGREQPNKRNYILIVTLKQLEEYNSRNAQRDSYTTTRQPWIEVYEQYRRGELSITQKRRDSTYELLNQLKTIQQQIADFQPIDIQSSCDINRNDNIYLQRLKSIVLGKYQTKLFNRQPIDETWLLGKYQTELFNRQAIDETWLLILALGLERKSTNWKWTDFKRQSKDFLNRWGIQKIANKMESNFQFDQWLASRVSLGAFRQLVEEYQQLYQNNKLNPYYQAVIIELFIILAFNPELIEQFSANSKAENKLSNSKDESKLRNSKNENNISRQTRVIIEEMMQQIGQFAQNLRKTNPEYPIYFTLIASLLANLNRFNGFEELPDKINKNFRIGIDDLFHRDCQMLEIITRQSKLAQKLVQNVLVNAKAQSNKECLNLADLCKVFNLEQKIEPMLFKCVIFYQIEPKNASEESSTFGNRRLPIKEEQQSIHQIIQKLNEIASHHNRPLIQFLSTLQQLKGLAKQRKVDELSAKQKVFQAHMEDERILKLLNELCHPQETRLMEVYVNYYEQLRAMYKFIYLAKNNIIQLRKKNTELGRQLEKMRTKYPALNSQRLGEFIADVYQ